MLIEECTRAALKDWVAQRQALSASVTITAAVD
jgi:hypothetical protein